MIALLSPAKKLDFESALPEAVTPSKPKGIAQAEALIDVLKDKSPSEIQELMHLSDSLTEVNTKRYQTWRKTHAEKNSKPAALAFDGAVYKGLDAYSFSKEEWEYAQNHVFILSGLYGLLRPADNIQPYRLEMGTKLQTSTGKNLYEYWGSRITQWINEYLSEGEVLVDLASKEYMKAVRPKELKANVLSVQFKDLKKGKYRTVMVYAKHARGAMAKLMVKHRPVHTEELKAYTPDDYAFNAELSSENTFVYTRD